MKLSNKKLIEKIRYIVKESENWGAKYTYYRTLRRIKKLLEDNK